MKYVMIILVAAAVIIGFYEQGKQHPNLYIMCGAIVVFMFAAMRLGSKIPSKNKRNSDDDIQ